MSTESGDIELYQGEFRPFRVTLVDDIDGAPYPLTGAELSWRVTRYGTTDIIKSTRDNTITVVDADRGICEFILHSAETHNLFGDYLHIFELIDTEGEGHIAFRRTLRVI